MANLGKLNTTCRVHVEVAKFYNCDKPHELNRNKNIPVSKIKQDLPEIEKQLSRKNYVYLVDAINELESKG